MSKAAKILEWLNNLSVPTNENFSSVQEKYPTNSDITGELENAGGGYILKTAFFKGEAFAHINDGAGDYDITNRKVFEKIP